MVERPCVITRSQPGAAGTAQRVAELGWTPVLAPAAMIEAVRPTAPLPPRLAGVVLTSAHAARLAPAALRHLPVWAVGDATARAARDAGFAAVTSAGADVGGLAALLGSSADRLDGPLLHLRGEEVAGDLAGALQPAGIELVSAIVYRMVPDPGFAAALDGASRMRTGAVLFHNPAAARAFAAEEVAPAFTGWEAIAISQAAFEPVAEALVWGEVFVAERPDEAAMLTALGPARRLTRSGAAPPHSAVGAPK